jgi:hypothetical protein
MASTAEESMKLIDLQKKAEELYPDCYVSVSFEYSKTSTGTTVAEVKVYVADGSEVVHKTTTINIGLAYKLLTQDEPLEAMQII